MNNEIILAELLASYLENYKVPKFDGHRNGPSSGPFLR